LLDGEWVGVVLVVELFAHVLVFQPDLVDVLVLLDVVQVLVVVVDAVLQPPDLVFQLSDVLLQLFLLQHPLVSAGGGVASVLECSTQLLDLGRPRLANVLLLQDLVELLRLNDAQFLVVDLDVGQKVGAVVQAEVV